MTNEALVAEVVALRAELAEVARVVRLSSARCLSIADACEAFSVSRSTFDRWLSDPASGLEAVVLRPNGPGGRVLVPVEGFEAWLRARSHGPAVAP